VVEGKRQAAIADGLQRKLQHTKAAETAKAERRKRNSRALDATGGSVYSQDARSIVERRQLKDAARLQQDLVARILRELTIANKWKRLLPTIRNWGKQYVKRAASGVVVERDVSRWQYAAHDARYNTPLRHTPLKS
jgi:hypothetical protein